MRHAAYATVGLRVSMIAWTCIHIGSYIAAISLYLCLEYSCTNSTDQITHCEVSKSDRKPRKGFSIEPPGYTIIVYCQLEIHGNYIKVIASSCFRIIGSAVQCTCLRTSLCLSLMDGYI